MMNPRPSNRLRAALTKKGKFKTRRLEIQSLERRDLLAAELRSFAQAYFAQGTPQSIVDNWGTEPFNYEGTTTGNGGNSGQPGINNSVTQSLFASILTANQNRWRNTAVETSPNLGDPVTVTWGFVADGTLTTNGGSGPAVASNLISFLDGIYGNGGTSVIANKPWFRFFETAYNMWGDVSGLRMQYEPNDDGVALGLAGAAGGAVGVLGVRADMRISGTTIDGNGNVLAFNFFPNNFGNSAFDGDMVIDTADLFYQSVSDGPNGENRGLVNVVAHEVGHGIGIDHVEPVNGTKLMEPFVNLSFFGVQEDDVFNANILYGDDRESNESRAAATNLGPVFRNATRTISQVSIDSPTTDRDFYRFSVTAPERLGVLVRPTGSAYLAGPQGGTAVPVNRASQNNLAFRVYDSTGAVLATQDARGLATSEFQIDINLPAAGDYFVEVYATGGQLSQAYELQLQTGNPLEVGPQLIAVRPDKSALLEDGDTLNVAPRELNLLFKGGANLDEATINSNSVRLIRSGGDGVFGNGNDVVVSLGYVGLINPGDTSPANLQEIVMRPASNAAFNAYDATASFPDDTYQILIIGAGTSAVTNTSSEPFNSGANQSLEFRLDRGAQVVAVVPQPVSRNTQQIVVPVTVTSGTYRLIFQGQLTASLPFNATNLQIQTALEALSNVQPGDVVVSGTREVTFQGQFAGEQVPLMMVTGATNGGTITVSRLSRLSQAANQIVVYFDDQVLNNAEVIDPTFYRLVNTATTATVSDDRTILPQSVTYDEVENSVVLTFATALAEGTYRIDIGQSGDGDSTLATAVNVGSLNTSNRFTKNAYLGDTNGSNADGTDVDLYKVQLPAASTLNLSVTPHSGVLALRARVLDSTGAAISTVSAGAGATLILNFAIPATGDYFVEISSVGGLTTGSYLIDMLATGVAISISDANTTIGTATNLGQLGAAGVTLARSITPQTIALPLYPGGQDEPGHREIQREAHIGSSGTNPALPINTIARRYYFPTTLGTDASGNVYANLITETEKQIVRELFEIYASITGYEFIESDATIPGSDQLMIGKGDFRAVSPSLGPNDGVAGLANNVFALVNGAIYDQADRFFGDGFTEVMMHEIGHSLGLGHAYEIPSLMGGPLPDDVLPGDHDRVHLQRIVPPNSTDIDMYRFQLTESGNFTAETIAERRANVSLLNTVLTLYRELPGGDIEMVARNDNYFGMDSFIGIDLAPGNYFIGVTSTGNTQFDPRVPNSGSGGTTNGLYDLRLAFNANRGGELRDASGTAIDGDADGTPGGVYSYWFQATDTASTIFVDRVNDIVANQPDGNGTLANPYDTVDFALLQAGNRIVVPTNAVGNLPIGSQFVINDGVNNAVFTFAAAPGINAINLTGLTTPAQVAVEITNTILAARTAGRLLPTVNVNTSGRIVQLSSASGENLLNFAPVASVSTGSPALLNTPNLVRIVGNGGTDQDLNTLGNNLPYLIGTSTSGNPLRDGSEFIVPQGTTVMIQGGALFKMRGANLDVGTSSVNVSRAGGAIQVLGTPKNSVLLRSFHDDTIGGNSDGVGPQPASGDFGGIVLRNDSDLESAGIFLNYINHADIDRGGGQVNVDSVQSVFSAIHLIDARPSLSFNRISRSGDAAISASPNSFEDTLNRIGPDILGNFLVDNTFDGLFVRVETAPGSSLGRLTVPGRFDDVDIPHVLTENLLIFGGAGGPTRSLATGVITARIAGRLVVDPGVVLKLENARIETERGSSALIAEGTPNRPIVFTSLNDDRYGGSGSFDTNNNNNATIGRAGDWGGLFFSHNSSGSIDQAIISFGGGNTPTEGVAANFNVIEVHQSTVRIANSLIKDNAGGSNTFPGGSTGTVTSRGGRGANEAAAIYVRGAQPVIVNNTIVDNIGAAISINANSLRFDNLRDPGRSTGNIDSFDQFADNAGPLVRLNRLENNSTNGMLVRARGSNPQSLEQTVQAIWDDTDIVHVLSGELIVGNHHTYSGLRLQSSNSESLVVKVTGANSGFTATGTPLETLDRIGGTIQVLGTVGHPVVVTHINDDSVGAGFTPGGLVMSNTDNSLSVTQGVSGGWRGFRFDEFSNDRNVAIIRELENPLTNKNDVNLSPATAQFLGDLAPNQKSGDENNRLGFEVQGFISPNDPNDVDVYSFRAVPGTDVWLDIDRTDPTLDAIIEVVTIAGTVLASSARTVLSGSLNPQSLTQNPLLGGDFYSQNFRDPGMLVRLPGTGTIGTYFIRVRSNPASAASAATIAGESRGKYQLQLRLQQVDEFPGSTVQYSDIRFANTAIDVRGLPSRSPLIGEAGETTGNDFGSAQQLVNLLESDMAALSIAGNLSDENDLDWYQFDVAHLGVQVIPGVNDAAGTVAVVFDLDYSDNAVRADSTVAIFDSNRNLIFVGRESNIEDDQPSNPLNPSTSVNDLSRGSLGKKDPYVGPIHLTAGQRYFVAVMSDYQLPSALTGAYLSAPTNLENRFTRLEPINSVTRIVEDHIGFSGYESGAGPIAPTTPQIFDISNSASLATNHIVPVSLTDVGFFVATDRATATTDDQLYIADPFNGGTYRTPVSPNSWSPAADDIQDIAIRSDGRFFGYQRAANLGDTAGRLVEINPDTGATLTTVGLDNVPGTTPTPNTRSFNVNLGSHLARADQFTNTDDVDALAFERTGPITAAPTYDVYYSVRESDLSSKLYRGRGNGDATPAAATANSVAYGLMGSIQTGASTIIDFNDGVTTAGVRISSLNGATFNLRITRNPNVIPITASGINVATQTATINISDTFTPTVGDLINFINTHPQLSQFLLATVASGTAASLGSLTSPAPVTLGTISDSATNYVLVPFNDGVNIARVRISSLQGSFALTLTRNAGVNAITAIDTVLQTITVNLDSAVAPTTGQLINLINNDVQANTFLRASISNGGFGSVGTTASPAAGGFSDVATAYTSVLFDNGVTNATVRLSSLGAQPFQMTLTRTPAPTAITTVNVATRTLIVNINNGAAPTVQSFLDLINLNPQASQFLLASLAAGNAADVGSTTSPAPSGISAQATYATSTFTVSNNATPVDATTIRVKSNLPGANGNFTLNITRPGGNVNATIQGVNLATRTINLQIGNQNGGGPTAAAIVDAINNHVDARTLVTAVIVGGNANANGDGNDGTAANNVGPQTLIRGVGSILAGRVTGLAFNDPVSPTALFGVTQGGEFISINENTGLSIVLATVPGVSFQALTLGPQNAEAGIYRDMFFAISNTGALFAFDASGTLQGVFAGGATTVGTSDIGPAQGDTPVGIAFSPLDINLWHPTTRRSNDRGHGINDAADNTRDPASVNVTYATGGIGADRTFNQAQGGASLYFGFEQWNAANASNAGTQGYIPYDGINAQFGFSDEGLHRDLASNANLVNTYGFAGGSFGTLLSNPFSLTGSVREDRPTLYLNYFLETENHPGETNAGGQDPFRDSARIFASRDGGTTWELLATNNSALSNQNTTANGQAELPGFLSHLSDAGLNSSDPRAAGQQVVQELFDNSGVWRQLRVDLSEFANQADVRLRFDFATAGRTPNDPSNAAFGELTSNQRSNTSQDNLFEGFYIDDIIVGFAERGEMITGSNPDAAITNLYAGGARTRDPQFGGSANPDVLNGPYQLEVRRTESEYITQAEPVSSVDQTFDTNIRHVNETVGNVSGLLADRNRERPQGIFIVDSNIISDSLVVGINVQPGTAQAGGSVPHPGSTINFPQLNNERLVPGAVIQNNLIIGSSGIRFAGETTISPQRPVPFGRLINNTLVGDGSSIGIQVVGQSSPTLMNNLITGHNTGIANAGVNTVIRSNFFQANTANGPTGTDALIAAAAAPLFVDANNRNYYLVGTTTAVDSSLNTLQDRTNFLTFKTQLGISASPLNAPNRDVYGQLRVASGSGGGGGGASVFKDRGAVDRSDSKAPFAQLLKPVDNDSAGQDRDPNDTIVYLTDPIIDSFSILLADGEGPNSPFEGTGVNGLTVSDPTDPSIAQRAVTVVHDGVTLRQGIDYTLGYNSLAGVLLLTPLSSLWQQTGVYTITLDNTLISDLAGNLLRSNQSDGSTKFFIVMPDVRFDYGDAPTTSYLSRLVNDGARHSISLGASPRLGSHVDGEPDALVPPLSDDTPTVVAASSPNAPTKFAITTLPTSGVSIVVSTLTLPVNGDQLTVTVGSIQRTFQLVSPGFAPQRNTIGVPLLSTDNAASITARLQAAIVDEFVFDGDATIVTIDPLAPTTLTIETFDDEDGVAIGTFNNGANRIVFLDESATSPTTDADDVIGFLNPHDTQGTSIAITASMNSFLDAWIDFNGDGAFDPILEQIFQAQPLVTGVNRLIVQTPAGTTDKITWARFRISETGNLAPSGFAIGGEVEDYQVEVINVLQGTPSNDTYSIAEDGVLNTETSLALPSVFANDLIDPATFLPTRFIVNSQPTKGTLTVTDPRTGRFVYTPAGDFHGQDTFTYWISSQPIPGNVLPANATLATVTINVTPVNDKPLATNKTFAALEETDVTITAAQLIAGAIADELPSFPATPVGPTAPWNEVNQAFTIVSLDIDGTLVDAARAALGPVVTSRGSFAVTFTAGVFSQLIFTPALDLNRDNDRGVGPAILQTFQFTIRDSGESIDPDNGSTVPGTPLEDTKTASINVAPRNDTPTTANDFVTIGPVGTSVPLVNAWTNYFNGISQPVPVPTEDVSLVIPAGFLLLNDLAGSPTAIDENAFISGNDAPLRVVNASVNNRNATVSVAANGDITFVPPTDVYGNVVITYEVEDSGVDEDLVGARTVAPRRAFGTITVTLQPINDVPVTFDRALTFNESPNAGVDNPPHVFTAADLINGTFTESDSIPGLFASDLPAPFNETEQLATLRVVVFTTAAGTVDSASLSGGNGTLQLASDQGGRYEFDFVNGAFTSGRFFPAADYNQRTPFVAIEQLRFVIEDDGATTDPDLGGTVNLARQRSVPAVVTVNVLDANDAPIFTMPTDLVLSENDGTSVVQTDFITSVAPGELSALDELTRQDVTVAFVPVNVPAGLMTALPTITVSGSANNWPGTGTLTVFPAADAFGFAVYDVVATDSGDGVARSTTKRLTITINPVNDTPVAFPRAISVSEAVEDDGQTAILNFTAANLLNGQLGETPVVAGTFPGSLAAPYNEIEQALRVVRFQVPGVLDVDATINEAGLVAGTGTVSRTTLNGSVLTFTFVGGAFQFGTYRPPVNYNQRTPFVPNETFSYVISDDGRTTLPGSGFVNFNGSNADSTIAIPEVRSIAAQVTLSVTPSNDPPVFNVALNASAQPSFNILERDDSLGTVIPNAILNLAPSAASALDERARQSVTFVVQPGLSTIPVGLMNALPVFTVTGSPNNWPGSASVTVFPTADAVGTAIYVFDAIDSETLTPGFSPRFTRGTLTVNVRPVNDAPRVVSPTPIDVRASNPDELWVVNPTSGTIQYTLKEDNTGANGVTAPYIIDTRIAASTAGRIGLLDPYNVGPANEADGTLGGSQALRIISFPVGSAPLTTGRGGSVTVVARDANGFPTQFSYVPPANYNSNRGPVDFFDYTIEDNAAGIGETFNLTTGVLDETRLTRVVRAEFLLNPVNDQPLMTIPSNVQSVLEDSGEVTIAGFVTGISQGPLTAGDELSGTTGQTVTFVLTPQSPENGLFTVSPTIGPNGTLSFTPALDAVGSVVYSLSYSDSGVNNPARGDINSVPASLITINVRPLNDAPRVNTAVAGTSLLTGPNEAWSVNNSGTITYVLAENNAGPGGTTSPYVIDSRQVNSARNRVGLLDPFVVGPANEADATLGGSQILRIISFPVGTNTLPTALGGRITVVARDADNAPTRFEYTPPTNVNTAQGSRDSFTYTVQDDAVGLGETWNLVSNTLVENRLTRVGRIEFTLNSVNNPPEFTIPNSVVSIREEVGAQSIAGFATGIVAGPTTAPDERATQTVRFELTPRSPENGLFAVSPTISPTGVLTFLPAVDAVGTIEYVVVAIDNGPSDPVNGDMNTSIPATITINVRPVNDAPRLNPAVTGTMQFTNTNEQWSVDTNGLITYTLAEDNTQSVGNDVQYVIDTRRVDSVANRVGLLDVFTPGPANESDASLGGSQQLRITAVPATTILGGRLEVLARDADGFVTRIGYTPPANYNSLQGPRDSFSYDFEDFSTAGETWDFVSNGLVSNRLPQTGRAEFILNPLNDPPIYSGAANISVDEDSTTTAIVGQTVVPNFVTGIVAGPTGADDELLTPATRQTVEFIVTAVAGNTPGLFATPPSVTPDGTLSFVTASDANGTAQFTIVARDSGALSLPLESSESIPRTFTISVARVNDAPSFTAGADVTVGEDSGAYSSTTPYATAVIPGPANEIADGQTVSFTLGVPTAAQSLFAVQPQISSTGFLTFTPAANAVGTAVVTVTAVDSHLPSASSVSSLLTITIREQNDTPVASNFTVSGNEDNTVVIQANEFVSLGIDPDLASNPLERLSITGVPATSTSGASISVNSSGSIVYDPRSSAVMQALRPGQSISDTFTYTLTDTAGAVSNVAVVTVTVAGRNDAPVTVNDSLILISNRSSILRPLTNDFDVDGTISPDLLIITGQPTNGTISAQPDGTLTYTPRTGFSGIDTITYTVGDNLGQQSTQATISLDVAAAPNPPSIVVGSYIGEPTDIDLTTTPDPNDTLDFSSIVIVLDPEHGTVTIEADGQLVYQADEGYFGPDSFQYTISDTDGRVSDPVTVTVNTVNSRLQNPRAFTDVNADGRTTAFDALLVINYVARNVRAGQGNFVPVLDSDRGPNFYDVDGNRMAMTLDALRVINFIARENRRRSGSGEGEMLLGAPGIKTATMEVSVQTNVATTTSAATPIAVELDKIADEAIIRFDAAVDLLTWNAEEDDSESERLDALDQAWSEFSHLNLPGA